MKLFLAFFLVSTTAFAYDFGELNEKDQKHFKNDYGAGQNQRERTDMNVKEINRMWSEINQLKSKIRTLEEEVKLLKAKK